MDGRISDDEQLARGCRILAAEGQEDSIFGHASYRIDDGGFRLKASGFGLSEVSSKDLVSVGLQGERLAGDAGIHNEWPIHAGIYAARADVGAVVHTHPTYASAFSALDAPILPVTHEGSFFEPEGVARFDETSDLIKTADLGERLAEQLGGSRAILLRNHGLVAVGRSVPEAVIGAVVLETACRRQLLLQGLDGVRISTPEEVLSKRAVMYSESSIQKVWSYLSRRIRDQDPTRSWGPTR